MFFSAFSMFLTLYSAIDLDKYVKIKWKSILFLKNFISSNEIFIYIKNNTNNIRSFIVFIQLKFNLINKEDIVFYSMNMKI